MPKDTHRKIMKYEIITATSPYELAKEVQLKLDAGWYLFEGPRHYDFTYWYQAVIWTTPPTSFGL